MAYYDLFLNLWVMNQFTSDQVDAAVTKGYITASQAAAIKATTK